jgi:hypothetical protein
LPKLKKGHRLEYLGKDDRILKQNFQKQIIRIYMAGNVCIKVTMRRIHIIIGAVENE